MTRHRRYRMRRKTRLRLRAPAVTLFLLACLLSLDGTGVLRTGLLCAILHESAHALVYRKLWHRWPDLALSPFGICLQLRDDTRRRTAAGLRRAAGKPAGLLHGAFVHADGGAVQLQRLLVCLHQPAGGRG